MCLPLGCVKFVLKINTFLLVCASIFGFVMGIVQISKGNSDFWNVSDYSFNSIAAIMLICLSGFLLLITIPGMVVACKKSKQKCCGFIFIIGVFILFALTFCLAFVLSIWMPQIKSQIQKIQDKDCQECDKELQWICDMENLYGVVEPNFGKVENCKARYENDDEKFEEFLRNEKHDMQYLDKDGLAGVKYGEEACYAGAGDYLKKEYIEAMMWIESTLKCSGMCKNRGDIYYFSNDYKQFKASMDIKEGTTCTGKVKDWLFDQGQTTYIVSYAVSAFLFITMILTCCQCCHPEERKKDLYQRMSDAYN